MDKSRVSTDKCFENFEKNSIILFTIVLITIILRIKEVQDEISDVISFDVLGLFRTVLLIWWNEIETFPFQLTAAAYFINRKSVRNYLIHNIYLI